MSEVGENKSSLEIAALPTLENKRGFAIYDPANPEVRSFLKDKWKFGYNPLAYDDVDLSRQLRLRLPDGPSYDYSEPNHSYAYYRRNKHSDNEENVVYPNFLVHITKAGWIEYALRNNDGKIGKDNVWTGSHDPHRWWGGKFPDGFDFKNPPDRFVELMFDAEQLKEKGLIGKRQPYTDYYVFDAQLPLTSLVPTSRAYLEQVLELPIPS